MVLAVAENKVAMWVLALLQRRGRGMASNEPHDVLALQDAMAIVDGQQNRGAAEVEALQKAAAEVSGQLGEYMDQYQKLLKEQRENLALSKTEIKSTHDQLETLSKTAKGQFDGLAQKQENCRGFRGVPASTQGHAGDWSAG
jgi:chromosome segregation ATPase